MSAAGIHCNSQYVPTDSMSKGLLGSMDFNHVEPCLQRAFYRGNECFLEFLDISFC